MKYQDIKHAMNRCEIDYTNVRELANRRWSTTDGTVLVGLSFHSSEFPAITMSMPSHGGLMMLSPATLMEMAQMRLTFLLWQQGELDDLPPSNRDTGPNCPRHTWAQICPQRVKDVIQIHPLAFSKA